MHTVSITPGSSADVQRCNKSTVVQAQTSMADTGYLLYIKGLA